MAYLAIASWPLGEVDHSVSLIDRMQTRMAGVAHVNTLAVGRMHTALFEMMRGGRERAASNAFELARLAREHDLPLWRAFAVFLQGWATAASGTVGGGLEDMRRGVELLREQNIPIFDGLLKIALAEPKPGQAIRTTPSPSSTKRWRRAPAWATARSKRSFTASVAKCCSSATPPAQRPPTKPS